MQPDDHIEAVRREGEAFAAVLGGAELDAKVPTCPDWTLRDLARHLGGVHRWAAGIVGERLAQRPRVPLEELVGGWPDDGALHGWFRRGHAALVETLAEAADDLECFVFLKAPSPRAFWCRRQAHETAMHRVDAQLAVGRAADIAAGLAADGLDEMVDGFLRGRWGPRSEEPYHLRFEATDVGRDWDVWIGPDGVTSSGGRDGAGLTVRGTASDLYRLAWNRPAAGTVELSGDGSLWDQWRDQVRV